MKILKKICALAVSITVTVSLAGCAMPASLTGKPDESFSDFCDDVFKDQISTDYLTLHTFMADPESYGITVGDISLGDYTVKELKSGKSDDEEYLKKLKKYDYDDLTDEEQYTYKALESAINLDLSHYDYSVYFNEPLEPTSGIQSNLPFCLVEYKLYSKSDVDNYITLAKDVKRYIDQICAFEEEKSGAGYFMTDDAADEIIDQCNSIITSADDIFTSGFEDRLKALGTLSDAQIDDYVSQNQDAVDNYIVPAYQEISDTMKKLKGSGKYTGGIAGLENGDKYYELCVQSLLGTTESISDIKKLLNNILGKKLGDMQLIMAKNPDVADSMDENPKYSDKTPEEMLEILKEKIKDDYPEMPEVNYTVKYFPTSLESVLGNTLAMYMLPPYDKYEDNIIYVNGATTEGGDLFTTLSHEGYPGHMYQYIMAYSQDTSNLRKVLEPTGYSEGWATFVEDRSYTYEYEDADVAAVNADNSDAFMCLYGLADIGVNYSGWTKEENVKFWSQYGIDAEDSVNEIYDTLKEDPGLYIPYAVGYSMFENMRSKAEDELGSDYSYSDFTTFIVNTGSLPFDTLNELFDDWLSDQGGDVTNTQESTAAGENVM